MDNPANPTVVNEPPWHVSDDKPTLSDASLGGPPSPDTGLAGPAEPLMSGPEPSTPSAIPPIPGPGNPEPSELPPIPEPIVPPPEIPVPQTLGETSLPPLPPPPPLPFVIKPASPDSPRGGAGASLGGPASTTGVKPPKKGGGGKAVLASLIFFLIAITTGIGFYFFQKGGLPFNLGKKAAPGDCCNPNASPTRCGANENCVSDPIGGAGCTYSYICKTKTWAQLRCADIWYNGGYGNIPSDAQCCCRIVNPGSPCDEDCRFANEASYNSSMGTVIQFCDASSNPWRPSWQSRDNTDCDDPRPGLPEGYCPGINDPTDFDGECSVCNNKWRKPSVTPTPTPTQPTTKITPTPTQPTTKITPTPTTPVTLVTPTPTPTPPPLECLKVEASKDGIILSNLTTDIVPGDIITIYVTAPYAAAPFGVTDFAVRIRTDGPPPIEHIAISSNPDEWLDFSLDCSQCVSWKYDYTIPAGGVGNYTIDGFIKSGGVWR